MKSRKLVSMMLVVFVMAGTFMLFSGCNKNNKPRETNVTIKEDDPWYSAVFFKPDEIIDPYTEILNGTSFPFVVGDNLLIAKTGSYYNEDSGTYGNGQKFGLFTMDGDLICDNIMTRESDFGLVTILGAFPDGDNVKILFTGQSKDLGTVALYSMAWDTAANTFSEPVAQDIGLDAGSYISNHFMYGDYLVIEEMDYDDFSESITFLKNSDVIGICDLSETEYQSFMTSAVYMKNGNLILEGRGGILSSGDTNYSGDTLRLTFDPNNGNLISGEEAGTIATHNEIIGFDGRAYSAKSDGIYTGDELYISYADCDVNMNNMSMVSLLSVDPDKVVISGYEINILMSTVEVRLVVLEKAGRNPNAGKTVINAVSPIPLSTELMEGVLRYNRADHEYFIKPTVRSLYEVDLNNESEVKKFYNDFALDIISSTSPDIVFNANMLSGMMTDEYFLDLAKDVELDDSKFYSNIYDMSAVDGKYYMVPISFSLSGILVEKENLSEGQRGFTFDEYVKFVSDSCNGVDPMAAHISRNEYFMSCYQAMGDFWIEDGKADFDNEAFRDLMKYIKENVPPTVFEDSMNRYVEIYYLDGSAQNSPTKCKYLNSVSYDGYEYQARGFKDPVFCGLPSADRKGPSASIISSVSVTANTGVKKGCIEFIETLIDTEVQLNCEYFCINKEAQGMLLSDKYQEELKQYEDTLAKFQFEAQARKEGYYAPDEKTQAQLLDIIENIGSVTAVDEAVYDILSEEVRTYFDGDKDIDAVIDTINNRVQTYLNEK
ncbi:MAG: hypothetical protein J6U23_13885 [Clostridiales bacterium]|nr:hypothetical protein [Clostridiales bacterium]